MAIKGASRASRATKKNVLVNVIATTVILIVLFGIGYFVLFYSPTTENISKLKDQIAEFDQTIETGRNSQSILTALNKHLEELKAKNKKMPLFDNQPMLINTFNEIIGEKNKWTFNPGQSGGKTTNDAGDTGGQIFRRTTSISIQNLKDYDEAMAIVQKLHDLEHRVLVTGVSFNAQEPPEEGGVGNGYVGPLDLNKSMISSIVQKLHDLEHRVLVTGVSFNAQEPPEEGGVGNGYVGPLDLNKSMISLTVDMTFLEYIPAPPKAKAPAATAGGETQADAPAV